MTAHAWPSQARTFFADVCAWAAEEGSPFVGYAPKAVPIARKDLLGFGKARRRREARSTATVLDLEREMPKIRAYAFSRWREAKEAHDDDDAEVGRSSTRRAHDTAFWDWAILELLVQSGLRIQEARRLSPP